MIYSAAENLIRHVTLRQMQIFEAVVRLGGYTRAAKVLHLTQPTVSMQIKKLSETFDQPLLEQVGRHIQPTPAGVEVYMAAQEILERMVSLGESTQALDGIVKGTLRIAVVTTAKYFIPHMLGAFISQYPQVVPKLTVTNRDNVLERLKTKEDDLIIMGQVPQQLAVQAEPFMDNELLVAAPVDHPFCKLKNISLQQLSEQRLLLREKGSGTRLAVERLFSEHDITINPYMELASGEAIKQAVMAGLGLSVLSHHNLRLELADKHIAILDVEMFPLIRSWYIVNLKNKRLSIVAQTFLDYVLANNAKELSIKKKC